MSWLVLVLVWLVVSVASATHFGGWHHGALDLVVLWGSLLVAFVRLGRLCFAFFLVLIYFFM